MTKSNWLPHASFVFLQWAGAVYAKFYELVPARSVIAVALELLNQVCLLLAFLLPLKVIILIGSTSVPAYFPGFLRGFNIQDLAVGLGAVAALAFVCHLACQRLLVSVAHGATKKLAKHTKKLTLFGEQTELTHRAFAQFQGIFAGLVFAAAAFGVVAYLYAEAALVALLCLLGVYGAIAVSARLKPQLRARYVRNTGRIMAFVSGAAFLCIFGYIVADLIWLAGPNALIAILTVLLSRQALSRLSSSIQTAVSLTALRPRIDVVLFPDAVFQHASRETGFWAQVSLEGREAWIADLVGQVVGDQPAENLRIAWVETLAAGMAAFDVDVATSEGPQRFFVKVFSRGQLAQFRQERTLLRAQGDSLPAPVLLQTDEVDGSFCAIYEGLWDLEDEPVREARRAKERLSAALWSVEPKLAMVQMVERSRPPLAERLTDDHVRRIAYACNSPEEERCIQDFVNALPDIQREVGQLPLVYTNPGYQPGALRRTQSGDLVGPNWGNWVLEPIGFGWGTAPARFEHLQELLVTAGNEGGRVAESDPAAVELAAMLSEMLRLHHQERFRGAIALMPRCLEALEKAGAQVAPAEATMIENA